MKYPLLIFFTLCVAVSGLFLLLHNFKSRDVVIARSVSPNGAFIAVLTEQTGIDRNFVVSVSAVDGKNLLSFSSADEGRPSGGENLVWSKDSRWLLVLANNTFVEPKITYNNSIAYAAIDVANARIYSNAT